MFVVGQQSESPEFTTDLHAPHRPIIIGLSAHSGSGGFYSFTPCVTLCQCSSVRLLLHVYGGGGGG